MKRDKIQPIGKNPATASSRPRGTDLPATASCILSARRTLTRSVER
ncbi:hypothetical protein QP415_06895 [Pauljensenia sp. UMB3104]|nr:hypothetical protein [Pauljensenia sp. UMB3104]MDK7159581.1 hypothetical protein [Pauljensenia sp. UMB3104]